MKKMTAIILSLMLCVCVFSACAKGNTSKEATNDKLQPTEAADIEKLQPDEVFTGDFKNEQFTAHIEKNENDEIVVTIQSEEQKAQWTMSGYFGYETYRVNYDNAVKSVKGNAEMEYENGDGRIQFTDSDHFIWENGMESIENNQFERVTE